MGLTLPGATGAEDVAPLCVTVKVCPATVRLPVREVVPTFAATVNVAKAEPVRLFGPVTLIQPALLATVQLQSDVVVTAVLCAEAPELTASDLGYTSKTQGSGGGGGGGGGDGGGGGGGGPATANVNVFDGALDDEPPGPTAATCAK